MIEEFKINEKNNNDYNSYSYNDNDINLLQPLNINRKFGEVNDIVEFHILDNNNNNIESNYNFKNYSNRDTVDNSLLYNKIELDPESDLLSYGYSDGEYNLVYNFYKNIFESSFTNKYFISSISLDRKEIKLTNINLVNNELEKSYIDFISKRNESLFYSDFILNFGNNIKEIGVNVLLDITSNNSLFVKLYEPLSLNIDLKSELWINEIISESFVFQLNKETKFNNNPNNNLLRGPNFNVEINNSVSTMTPYLNISNILNSGSLDINSLKSITKDLKINIDFNDFSNFIHFSSAQERFENFIYKISNIQTLQNDLNILNSVSGVSISSIININNKIDNLLGSFDEYELFLYYESGSNSYPKSNSLKPYVNKLLNEVEVLEWIGSTDINNQYYGGQLLKSENYDYENRDYTWNNLPEYIKSDDQNDQLKLFISMIGQHFDSIWVYIKDITNKNVADNRLNSGISKDLVSETLKSFGIQLYTNSRNNNNIYSSFLGINPDGSFLPSTGSYNIDSYVTASNYTIPDNDINKEVYKRIYHNLPYLLKSKGTKKGLRSLLNCFGIPKTILDIKEYGGNIKGLDIIENKIEKFNYSFNGNNLSYINIPFYPSNKQFIDTGQIIYPDNIEFRFKADIPTELSQSILSDGGNDIKILLNYITGSEGTIQLLMNGVGNVLSEPIELPVFNNGWWSVNLYREIGNYAYSNTSINNTFTLVVSNNEYIKSSSIEDDGSIESRWGDYKTLTIGNFSGSIQEFRYWINKPTIENIIDHTLNPKSISYLNETGSYDNLIFRLPLGSELDNNITETIKSVHPNGIPSFINFGVSSSEALVYNYSISSYNHNVESYMINSSNTGGSTESNQKIKIIPLDIIEGNTLSISNSIVKSNLNQIENSNNLEVAFSPQNSINNNIIEQLGNFNIDEYIGDPRDKNKTKYQDLEKLKLFYFQKYLKKQNIFDLIKLLSYFDNSLFKMLKDFTPARTNLSTGLVIKSHILERNKVQKFEPTLTNEYLEGEIETSFISSSSGIGYHIDSSHTSSLPSSIGLIDYISDDGKELFNGEFENSSIQVHNKSKFPLLEFNNINPKYDIVEDIILNPILNNISDNLINKKLLKKENLDLLVSSLLEDNYNSNLFSSIQKYNYNLERHNLPRYKGSKLISKEYNKFTLGDKSYGSQPVIDNNKIKFAYFEEITSQSLTLPQRSNVKIKYIIDKKSNITELSKQNKNLFDIQNIFNVDNANIILDNKGSNLDGIISIYSGGYRLEPILQNLTTEISSNNSLEFLFNKDIEVLNESNINNINNLPNNSINIGDPILEFRPSNYSLFSANSADSNIRNDFSIKFPITRNTPYSGEIIQRITGNISIIINVKPSLNFVTRFYKSTNGTGNPNWSVIGEYINEFIANSSIGDPLISGVSATNNIRSINVPYGVTVTVANATNNSGGTNFIVTYNTPGLKNTTPNNNNLPLQLNNDGVDKVEIKRNINPQFSYFLSTYVNDFGGLPTFSTVQNTSIPLPDAGYDIEMTFNVSGDIIIPANSTSGIFYLLKPNTNDIGYIKSLTLISSNQKLSNTPITHETPLTLLGPAFYFSAPSEYTYITGSSDHGFNSGSLPIDNWFFERRNSILTGSFTNLLVGSHYLSNIIFNSINNDNEFIQSYSELDNLGYNVVNDYFNIKTGDIIKFYNKEKQLYPINFEFEIKNIKFPLQISSEDSDEGRFIIETVKPIPNQACSDFGGINAYKIQNFIILSKIEDETNIIINKINKNNNLVKGIIHPENLPTDIKEEIGNIIKDLKNQNII